MPDRILDRLHDQLEEKIAYRLNLNNSRPSPNDLGESMTDIVITTAYSAVTSFVDIARRVTSSFPTRHRQ